MKQLGDREGLMVSVKGDEKQAINSFLEYQVSGE